MKFVLLAMTVAFGFSSFADGESAFVKCEGTKIISNGNPSQDIKSEWILQTDEKEPWKQSAEVDGLIFDAMIIPASVMFSQSMTVSIKQGDQVYGSIGSIQANVMYTNIDKEAGQMTIYGLRCFTSEALNQ